MADHVVCEVGHGREIAATQSALMLTRVAARLKGHSWGEEKIDCLPGF